MTMEKYISFINQEMIVIFILNKFWKLSSDQQILGTDSSFYSAWYGL